jgi:MFS family permease
MSHAMSTTAQTLEGASFAPQSAAAKPSVSVAAWYALGVLFVAYALNFLDRNLMYVLFTPVQKELGLNDFQIALLGATAFVIFYTALGIPFGRLADRVVRKKLIAAGLATWCIFSGLTGFCQTFWQILLCRVMVGVGEATLGPAALSLISDHFPPRLRATAQSIYAAGIPIGTGLGLFLGGWVGAHHGWRWAFLALGFPGLIFALIVLTLREPARGVTEARGGTESARAAVPDWRILFSRRVLWLHYAGYALFAFAGAALLVWIPKFLIGVHRLDLASVGRMTGIAVACGGLAGSVLGGWAADRLRRRRKGGRMLLCAVASLASAALWLPVLHGASLPPVVASYALLVGISLAWLGPAFADLHEVVGPQLRGLSVGVFFFIANIVAWGVGQPAIGRINDALGAARDPAVMATSLLVAPAACVVAALALWLGSRELDRG